MRRLLTLAACALLAALGQNGPKKYPVGGRVVEALSGKPVAGVRMVLSPEGSPELEVGVQKSDEQGRFLFQAPAGRFHLRAERLGLPAQRYLQPALSLPMGSALITGGNENLSQLTFRLLLPAAITGTVRDEENEPVDGASVSLIERRVVNGIRSEGVLKAVYTNDLGEFRFGGLSSGLYSVAVVAKPWYAGKSRSLRMTYEPAFFPANAGATPIVLGAGQEVDVPFRLRLVNAGTLEVTVPPSEERGRVLEQDLVIANPDGVRVELEARKGYRDRVVTLDLAAGEYEVALVMSEGGRRLHASRTVPVSAVETRLALEPMVSPVVRVRVEASGQVPAGLTLTHMKTGQVTAQALGVGQQAEFADLPPGEYRLGLGGGQAYLKGVFDGEKQLPDGRFRLERAPVELMAKTGSTPGEVRGVVLQDQRVAPGMLVALVPLDQVEDSRRYRGYQTDSDGSFRFANVPPGEYGLLVSENPRLEFALAATLQPLLERAVKVTVTAKGSVTLELEARP